MTTETSSNRGGRRRDASRDAVILEATLDVLGEEGFERMTMDVVAARAKAGKATLYRRWPSKPDLVLDAVRHMAGAELDLADLPDTGAFRSDLLGLARPQSAEEQARRLKVMAGVASVMLHDRELAAAVHAAVVEPWVQANRLLMQRAVGRGELPSATDVDTLAETIPAIVTYRSVVEHAPVDIDVLVRLVDVVLLPAIYGAGAVP